MIKLTTVILTLALAAVAGSAQALDRKAFSGNGCEAYFGSNEADLDASIYGIHNRASGNRWVSCPIVRDNTTNTNGTSVVWVGADKGVGTLSCYLRSQQGQGSNVTSDSAFTSAFGKQWLRLDVNSSSNYGYYMLYCSLPSNSRIASYHVEEFTFTDVNN